MVDQTEYQISREIRLLIEDMLVLKSYDLERYMELRNNLKKDLGEEFYNKHLSEALE